ncbi:MAG: LysM peptidoglycan-binding domain-containing protein [Anaerolineae bacterium]|nr:LysM peptidoglycan-binding domain-containing protein [Anaerolineae bacterium]
MRPAKYSFLIYYLLGAVAMLFLAGCNPNQANSTGLPDPTTVIQLYETATPTPTPSAEETTPTATVPPLPSPTPFQYEIAQGDTPSGIAARFGISLDDLYKANPEIDPRFLSIGTKLVIPLNENPSLAPGLPTPTPPPVENGLPYCYPTPLGDLICYWLLENRHAYILENLSAVFTLYDASGEIVGSEVGITPLNILRPGDRLPLVAVFRAVNLNWVAVQAEVVTALQVSEDSTRYIFAGVDGLKVKVNSSGSAAEISGEIILPEEGATVVWAAAVAYDDLGRVVGTRRWETASQEGLQGNISFQITVFSLGPNIDHVEIIVEARP